ncbi:MAG TPA: signal peptide peptidase SppA, partial [Leptospiraceae bacterium]|nr:signal peptide peptidase SppA [Leptospiraceae bacterium]
VIGHSEGGGIRTLYLLSCCSERFASPASSYSSFFPASEPHYFKGLLKKFGVRMEVFSAGKYKSAGETFSRSGPSKEARENLEELISGLRANIARGMEARAPGFAKKFKNKLLWSASELVTEGFFSREITEKDLARHLSGEPRETVKHAFSTVQPELEQKGPQLRITSDGALVRRHLRSRFKLLNLSRRRSFAFVAMEGAIYSGRKGDHARSGMISGHAYRDLLHDLADSRDEAVIVWINSPGGTPDGSEIVYQALRYLGEKKPVVALMASVAASGGYYIASAAHRIFSLESTITGSIGVVRLQPDAEKFYEKLGVESTRIGFEGSEDILSVSRPVGREGRRLLDDQIQSTYSTFVQRVADGRGKSPAHVRRFAEGKVFTGKDFLASGLVDEIRGIPETVDFLKSSMGIPAARRMQLSLYPEVRVDLRTLVSERFPISAALPLQALARQVSFPFALMGKPVLYFPHEVVRFQ